MIRVHVREGVPARTRRQVERFAEWASEQVNVPDALEVVLLPYSYLSVIEALDGWERNTGDVCIGLFHTPTHREGSPVIFLAARRRDVLETLAHELMHYCQWRDGLELIEGDGEIVDVDAEGQALLARYYGG